MSEPASPAPPAMLHNGPVAAHGRAPVGGFLVDLLIAVGVMLVVSMGVYAAWAFWEGFRHVQQGVAPAQAVNQALTQPNGTVMIWITLIGTGMAALIPYWFRRRATAVERGRSLAALRRPATWAWIVLAALGVFALSASLTSLGRLFGIAPEPSNEAPIRDALLASPWFVGIFVVVLAPIYEELLFRRVLFGRLWAAGRPYLGILLSAVAFALMHEPPGLSANSWPATCMLWTIYGGMGVVFAWVYRRTGTLWAPITAHALNNALALALLGAA